MQRAGWRVQPDDAKKLVITKHNYRGIEVGEESPSNVGKKNLFGLKKLPFEIILPLVLQAKPEEAIYASDSIFN